jgi:hypothetical protein
MNATEKQDPRVRALAAALSLNRGELDAAKLAALLRIVEREPAPGPANS